MALEQALQDYFTNNLNKFQFKAIAIGVALNITETTCDVERAGEPTLKDVRLIAADEQLNDYVLQKPKNGSAVVVGLYENNSATAIILKCSEVEKFKVKIGTSLLEIDTSGITAKRGNDTLKQVHQLTIEAIMQVVVIIGNNPAYDKLTQALTKLNNILK